MNEKFDPAPPDPHAVPIKEATKANLKVDKDLRDGLVGGSFPASDPVSATQPKRSPADDIDEKHKGEKNQKD